MTDSTRHPVTNPEMIFVTTDPALEIRSIAPDDLPAVLEVYRQCEDFLALGPVSSASLEMVLKDIEISREAGGYFCGIFTPAGEMIGILDYVPGNYQGDPEAACLSLLMIAAPWRNKGVGQAVVVAVEAQICENPGVTTIFSGVQVNNPGAIRFWQKHGYRITSAPILHPDQTTAFDLRKDLDR